MIKAYINDVVCDNLPPVSHSLIELWPQMRHQHITSNFPRDETKIDIILSVSDIGKILKKGSNLIVKEQEESELNNQNLYALNTIYGWCIAGAINLQDNRSSYKTICEVTTNKQLNETLSRFWQIEEKEK